MRTAVSQGGTRATGGEPGEELSPVEVARLVRAQGSLVFTAANPDLMQPLARRAERIPMVASPPGAVRQASGPTTGVRAPTYGAAEAVPRVVHRPAPTPAEPDDDIPARAAARRNDAHPLPWDSLSMGGQQPTLDPAHLSRLADQVVRVIDDRVIATRERMGRI
jgi:hypothetical protein